MTQIELLMKKLGCTKEEALDIIKTDKEINKGADPFPLTAEQKKVEKARSRLWHSQDPHCLQVSGR